MSFWDGAGSGLIGAAVGGITSAIGAGNANKDSWRQAKHVMAHEAFMSNTAYQRAVSDMKLAGINPMMAASKGGASAGGGQMGQVQNEMEGVSNSAAAMSAIKANLEKVDTEIAVNKVNEEVKKEEKKLIANTAKKEGANARLAQTEVPRTENRAKVEDSEVGRKYDGVVDAITDRLAPFVNAIGSGFGAFLRGSRAGKAAAPEDKGVKSMAGLMNEKR